MQIIIVQQDFMVVSAQVFSFKLGLIMKQKFDLFSSKLKEDDSN